MPRLLKANFFSVDVSLDENIMEWKYTPPTICVQYLAYSLLKAANFPKRSLPPIFHVPLGVGDAGSSPLGCVLPVVQTKRRTILVYSPSSSFWYTVTTWLVVSSTI